MIGFLKKHRILAVTVTAVFSLWIFWLILFSPFSVRRFIIYSVRAFTNASISLNVEHAGPFTGFHFTDILLESSDGEAVFTAKNFSASWSLPGLLTGSIGISGLNLTDAVIYITQRPDGSWNYEDLTGKPSAESKEQQIRNEFPFPLRFFLKADIKNLSVVYRTPREELQIRGISLHTDISTKRMKTLPAGADILKIFKNFIINFNPEYPLELSWNSPEGSVRGPLVFSILTDKSGDLTETVLRADTSGLVMNKNSQFIDYDLTVLLRASYSSGTDSLHIKTFIIKENDGTDFLAEGELTGFFSDDAARQVRFSADRSVFSLDKPGRIVSIFMNSNGPPAVQGTLNLLNLNAEGSTDNLKINAAIRGSSLQMNFAGSHSIPHLSVKCTGVLTQNAAEGSPIGFIKHLDLTDLDIVYNNAKIRGHASVDPERGADAVLEIKNFRLDPYTAPWFYGDLSGRAVFGSSMNLDLIRIKGDLSVRNGRYMALNELSGLNHFFLTTDAQLEFRKGETIITLKNNDLTARNVRYERALDLRGDIDIRITDKYLYNLKFPELSINYNSLHPSLPPPLRLMLAPYREYIHEGLRLQTDMKIEMDKSGLLLISESKAEIPFLKLDDLHIKTDIFYGKETTEYRKLEINTLRKSLVFRMTGRQGVIPGYSEKGSLLNLNLNLDQPSLFRAHPLIELKGLLHMDLKISPDGARGYLKMKDLDLNFRNEACLSPVTQKACQVWKFKSINIDLPLKHQYSPARFFVPANFLETRSSLPESVSPPGNFSVGYIATLKYPSGQPRKGDFYIIGSPDYPDLKGLTAFADYSNNVIFLNHLKMLMFKETITEKGSARWEPYGYISGTGLYFNLSDFNPANQEFGVDLQVRRLDLAPWLESKVAIGKQQDDGVISFDLTARASGLHEMITNTKARISVHEISPRFTGFATRLLVPVAMVAWAANATLRIPSIQLELKEGLIYSSVAIERGGLLSLMLKPSGEVIRQDRIPLGQFLERAKSEARILNRSSSDE